MPAMGKHLYDPSARKKAVSISVNGDLLERAKSAGLNISGIAGAALASALAATERERVREDVRQDMAAYNDYVERFGSPTEMLREYLNELDNAV